MLQQHRAADHWGHRLAAWSTLAGRRLPPHAVRTAATVAAVGALGMLGASAGTAAIRRRQAHWIFHPASAGDAGALVDGSAAGGATQPERPHDVWIELDAGDDGQVAPAASPSASAPANTAADVRPRVRLHGRWMPPPTADGPVLLYLHGARTNLHTSRERMGHLQALGCGVLGVDYRGFGHSAGSPSEQGVLADARAAWEWLVARHPQARAFVYGHSLGSAIAVQLVEQLQAAAADAPGADIAAVQPAGLILEGAFTSIPDVVRTMRWGGWLPLRPLGPLITQRFDSAARIGALRTPLLVVHGSDDRLIPPHLGRALYERATATKQFVLVDGGTHHSTHARGAAQYRQALAELFDWRVPAGATEALVALDAREARAAGDARDGSRRVATLHD